MTPHHLLLVTEVINDLADHARPLPQGIPADYLLCLHVERELNGVRELGLPYEEIHRMVMDWLEGALV